MGTQQGKSAEPPRLHLWEIPLQVRVNELVEIPYLCALPDYRIDQGFPQEDLENEHAECINVALVGESASGSIFWGEVSHGSSGLELREENVIHQEPEEARVCKHGIVPVVKQDILHGDVLMYQRWFLAIASVEIVNT